MSARTAAHLWDDLPGIDERYVRRFSTRAVAETAAMRAAGANLAAGMLTMLLDDDIPVVGLDDLAATADPEVWRQPFLSTWHALSVGQSFTAAVGLGRGRAETTGRDEVTRTERSTFSAVDSAEDRIHGWRRVPAGKVCHWCATVATQRYKSAESAAFGHNNCSCTPVPIIGDRDPGRFLNRGLQNVPDSAYVTEDGAETSRPEETPA